MSLFQRRDVASHRPRADTEFDGDFLEPECAPSNDVDETPLSNDDGIARAIHAP
jgi:hypothetical protein